MKRIRIKNEPKNIKATSAKIIGFLRKQKRGLPEDVLFDIKLCIEEALRNAMIHGNRSDGKKPVDISYDIIDNRFIISIEDQGKGFDASNLPDPTKGRNLAREGGRGVYLMYRLMDKVCYNDRGNCVTMEKALL